MKLTPIEKLVVELHQKVLDGKFNGNTRTTVLSLISKHSSGVELSFKQKELMDKLNKGD